MFSRFDQPNYNHRLYEIVSSSTRLVTDSLSLSLATTARLDVMGELNLRMSTGGVKVKQANIYFHSESFYFGTESVVVSPYVMSECVCRSCETCQARSEDLSKGRWYCEGEIRRNLKSQRQTERPKRKCLIIMVVRN